MDSKKTGEFITQIRKNKSMTQKEVATRLNVSDKTISKWERGAGCPDIAILKDLAQVLGVNITEILSGEMIMNEKEAGNMKKTKFYVCKECGNIVTSSSTLILTCCGNELKELIPNKEIDEKHRFTIEQVEDELLFSIKHPMTKSHYISFVAYVTCDKLWIGKLYPEQEAMVRLKKNGHGMLYVYCNQDGFFEKRI